MATGQIGFKVTLKLNDGGTGADPGGTLTAIPGNAIVTLPSREIGEVDDTDHDQTDFYERVIPGLIKSGNLKFECKYSHGNYTRLNNVFEKRKLYTWEITAPIGVASGAVTGQKFTVSGFLKKIDEMPFEREGTMMMKAEVRLSGTWTVDPGADA